MDLEKPSPTDSVGTPTDLGEHGVADRVEEDEVSGFLEIDASTRIQGIDKQNIQIILFEFLYDLFPRNNGSFDLPKMYVIVPHSFPDQIKGFLERRKNNHLAVFL